MQKYKPSILATATLLSAAYMIDVNEAAFGPSVDDVDLMISRHNLDKVSILMVSRKLTYAMQSFFEKPRE